ncbi:MAG: M20/M25/M40 family metallo-hydrolase [Chloroflexi bacterium]|nr:M20/M25/M40 family metallo-hydrolase [Chloroflexota bacterium]
MAPDDSSPALTPSPDPLQPVFNHLRAHFDEHFELARRLIRQPSVSPTNEGVEACGELLLEEVRKLGPARAELARLPGAFPLLFAEFHSRRPDARTLMIYSLYDVMPVEGESWTVPPFAAEVVEPERVHLPNSFGPCLVARGAYNHKGPVAACLNAIRALRDVQGDLPVNVVLFIEGEEELGSPHLAAYRDLYPEELRRVDAVYAPNANLDSQEHHFIHLGIRGLLMLELIERGGAWGGPARHAIFPTDDAWVDAPAQRLAWALASLKEFPGGRVAVDGFYDRIVPLPDDEQGFLERLKASFVEAQIKAIFGIERFKGGRPMADYLDDYLIGPIFNIDGYYSGYTGPKVKTTFPHEAVAKIDIRLVPNMDRDDILARLRKHLDERGFPELEIVVHGGYNWSKTTASSPVVQAAVRAAARLGYETELYPMSRFCNPQSIFNGPPLFLPRIDGGLAHGGRSHQPDEFLALAGFETFERYVVTFLDEFSRAG